MADAGLTERERHGIAFDVVTDAPDELHVDAGRGDREGDTGRQPADREAKRVSAGRAIAGPRCDDDLRSAEDDDHVAVSSWTTSTSPRPMSPRGPAIRSASPTIVTTARSGSRCAVAAARISSRVTAAIAGR